MLFFVGFIIVISAVITGYTAHGGNLAVLWQPTEVIIILGSAIGATVIANPSHVLLDMLKSLKFLFKRAPYDKKSYLELLILFFQIFKLMKTKGNLEIESHIENPLESELFNKSTQIISNEPILKFICDYLRLITMGVENQYHFEDLINKEIEVYTHEVRTPGEVLLVFGESLPALGIVAAVLGVIITMGSITEPPEILGKLIGAALVGTFLGVLLSYAVFSPMGHYLLKFASAQCEFVECIKSGFISHLQGNAPTITVEFMRKVIPEHERPSFQEVDTALNGPSE